MKSANIRLASLGKSSVELYKFRPWLFRAQSLLTVKQKLGPSLRARAYACSPYNISILIQLLLSLF